MKQLLSAFAVILSASTIMFLAGCDENSDGKQPESAAPAVENQDKANKCKATKDSKCPKKDNAAKKDNTAK